MIDEFDLTLFDKLAEPFPPEAISWRVGSTNKKKYQQGQKKMGKPLAYLDARDVMDRLDIVCGPDCWGDNYTLAANYVCCSITIRHDGNVVSKSDGAGHTQVEGEKGQFSDAFKRAAVKFGIGRYLYDCDSPWIELDDYWRIPDEAMQQLNTALAKASNRHEWGDRNTYNMFRLLKGSLQQISNTPGAIPEFLELNKGTIAQLKVGARRELEKEVARLMENHEAMVA